ncbi:citrate/2-methylcitrate synthase [uncultured Agrococcus sp.]|uniref:citrate/2-methylcitrate synthase n=1 Tax=uncultured Agrococcus sp. TaxID=382258 RepID=UPI0025E7E613|nr:citrate/2-methylcitrate synthase [uncultured Agrococcus sp.]
MGDALPRLTVAQTAARLGVKIETVYAYVSRGMLARERSAAGSTFDPLEVEAFARSRRPSPSVQHGRAATDGRPLMVLETDIANIEDDELFYRGTPLTELVATPFEDVATWLWRGELGVDPVFPRVPDGMPTAMDVISLLPPQANSIDRLRTTVNVLGAADPMRHDPSVEQLRRVGAGLLTGFSRALGDIEVSPDASIAAGLWSSLGGVAESDLAGVRAVNAALVVTADHDLAVSTFAARIAASARADGYSAVSAALGAFDSPLHGTASLRAVRMISDVVSGTAPEVAVSGAVREGGRGVPGFGQPLYVKADPRAEILLPLVEPLADARPVLDAVRSISEVVGRRARLFPNIDLALAALVRAARMTDDAGSAIFAIGRTAGWIAHILAEYGERPLRLRPRGRFSGA